MIRKYIVERSVLKAARFVRFGVFSSTSLVAQETNCPHKHADIFVLVILNWLCIKMWRQCNFYLYICKNLSVTVVWNLVATFVTFDFKLQLPEDNKIVRCDFSISSMTQKLGIEAPFRKCRRIIQFRNTCGRSNKYRSQVKESCISFRLMRSLILDR